MARTVYENSMMPPTTEPQLCERNGCEIPPEAETHLIYGATWCAACADDPDQYASIGDYEEQRGL